MVSKMQKKEKQNKFVFKRLSSGERSILSVDALKLCLI